MAFVTLGLCLPPALAVESANQLARDLLAKVAQAVQADPTHADLVGDYAARAEQVLARAAEQEDSLPKRHRELLDDLALEWARVAADLVVARSAEREADELERELSRVETELSSSRAAVEQAKARLGRARAEVAERGRADGSAPGPATVEDATGSTQ